MRELEALPATIAALEREQSEITAQLGDADFYRDQPDKVHALQQRYSAIENELMESLTKWEELEGRQAKT
jgi:ATP-binding cassette subfamily F protein uup